MNTLDHIILVFTAPRSYSSMLTKCIYDCGAFAIQRLSQKSKALLEHEETLRVLQEFEDLYNN